MEGLQPIDIVAAAVLFVAALRGVFLGLVREAFSLAGLAAACLAVRVFTAPVAAWIGEVADGRIASGLLPWVAGALVAIGTLAAVAIAGRIVRRGVHAVGLGWADRAGGALLGGAEGVLVVAIVLVVLVTALGRGHPALSDSRSLAALERLERLSSGAPIDVAAPPR